MSPDLSVVPGADGLRRTQGADVDLSFQVRGSGPVVVLLHGTSANHAVWEPIVDALAARATLVCLDQRGHGRSDKPASGYGGRDFADDVLTVLDALGIDRAIVGGHSLGARNAWLTAALHPLRVDAVLAVDYTPFVETEVLDDLERRVAGGDRSFLTREEIEGYLHQRYPRLPPDAVRRRAEWGYRQATSGGWRPLADASAMQQLVQGLRVPHAREFADVAVPMTHLRGGLSRIVGDTAWDRARAARPADRWVVDPDVDHYLPEEHPKLVVDELERLVDLSS